MDQRKIEACTCPPAHLRKSVEMQRPMDTYWDDQFYSKFKKFFMQSEKEMVQQQ